ncbi:Wadjet anti-phage system protein JetA family protein [Clostridium sp. AM58-1XD]|uniref:Wadjet anti-phage system protein JetA family protein n=1 Tax=Clostridium sp. AM58-1XD TaxID=2292307 RepID=UPI0026B12A53
MTGGKAVFSEDSIRTEEDFEKMILAYDGAGKKKGRYHVEAEEGEMIDNGSFCYPKLTFIRRKE